MFSAVPSYATVAGVARNVVKAVRASAPLLAQEATASVSKAFATVWAEAPRASRVLALARWALLGALAEPCDAMDTALGLPKGVAAAVAAAHILLVAVLVVRLALRRYAQPAVSWLLRLAIFGYAAYNAYNIRTFAIEQFGRVIHECVSRAHGSERALATWHRARCRPHARALID